MSKTAIFYHMLVAVLLASLCGSYRNIYGVANMTFVCLSIVVDNLTIVAWSIVSVTADMTFTNLFDSLKPGKYTIIPTSKKLTHSEIEKVFIGKDKTLLSVVDQRLNIVKVTFLFGSYVKFIVKFPDKPLPTSSSVVMRNTFEIMRKFQQLLSQRRLPQCLPEQTKKDKLFNDLLNLLETKSVGVGTRWS